MVNTKIEHERALRRDEDGAAFFDVVEYQPKDALALDLINDSLDAAIAHTGVIADANYGHAIIVRQTAT